MDVSHELTVNHLHLGGILWAGWEKHGALEDNRYMQTGSP